jgi:quercetin dioxygenase-like cupin family protein
MKFDSVRLGPRLLLLSIAASGVLAGCCRTPSAATAATSVEPVVAFELPDWSEEGPKREHEVLFEGDGMKIAAIALRGGTELPEHTADAKVSIQVLRGSGQLSAGERMQEVGPGSIVVLEPSLPHAVKPAGEELMVLIVSYFGPS